jgi:mersacidin/lichenicidin family type 2 lantibiotic
MRLPDNPPTEYQHYSRGGKEMSSTKLIRAWKDEEYRLSLSEAERALLPENPAGSIELTDAELEQATGAWGWCFFTRLRCGGSCDFTAWVCKWTCEVSFCGFTG